MNIRKESYNNSDFEIFLTFYYSLIFDYFIDNKNSESSTLCRIKNIFLNNNKLIIIIYLQYYSNIIHNCYLSILPKIGTLSNRRFFTFTGR